ncbi:helix-turn-helix transcriptional regulator [Calothrix rhizosoleniae]|uniref:helix-turn-helix transcriptional regulator n=1 Tax=Calothrix rhizosoleniae TaxID=888997 RepID=UPI000B49E4EA|nr:AraC family transcriptional regulator [Calothrix rhizosoleniae]
MTKYLVLKEWNDWLLPGQTNDTRLFHSHASDCIRLCPPQFGEGYTQEIPLREDLMLIIIDYTLDHELIIDAPGTCNHLEFEFQLSGRESGYTFFAPDFGLRGFAIKSDRRRFFKVEVVFKPPSFSTYFHKFIERLSPPLQQVSEDIIHHIYQHHIGKYDKCNTIANIVNVLHDTKLFKQLYFEQILSTSSYTKLVSIAGATRSPITPAMNQVIEQILNCPYSACNRRRYLECKALELVALRLDALVKPRSQELKADDLVAIYQAEEILRTHLQNPPSIENLTRWVGLNRLKLNQGFHQVYSTTPFGYLRNCRLAKARHLLMTSESSVEKVASSVGYNSRSRFATAFRRQFGLNPKTFQIQAWNQVS